MPGFPIAIEGRPAYGEKICKRLVKDGRGPCPRGESACRTNVDVHAGDVLETPAGAGDISHVTYCGCPA